MVRKKAEGIELLQPKQDPVDLQDMTLLDFMAAFALLGASPMNTPEESAKDAYDKADAMLNERVKRL
jgi:hypothetical protein